MSEPDKKSERQPFKIFHFEDNQSEAFKIQFLLGIALEILITPKKGLLETYPESFGGFSFNVDKDLDLFQTAEEAQTALNDKGSGYHLFILDLIDEEGDNTGQALADAIRAKKLKAAIIGISKVEQTDRFAGLSRIFLGRNKLEDRGNYQTYGVAFYNKRDLTRGKVSIEEFAETLIKVCADAKVIKPEESAIELSFRPDINDKTANYSLSDKIKGYALDDSKEKIGEARLKDIIFNITNKQVQQATVHYLNPGLSGAIVLRIQLTATAGELLVKFSKTKEDLQKELNNVPPIQSALSQNFVKYRPLIIKSNDNKWHAIYSQFFNGVTLRDYILEPNQNREIPTALNTIFIEGLGDFYRKQYENPFRAITQVKDDGTPLAGLQKYISATKPKQSPIARILLFMEQFGSLLAEYTQTEENTDSTLVAFDNKFVYNALHKNDLGLAEPVVKSIKTEPLGCQSHGDLHAKNIMIAENGYRFVFIDPDHSDLAFWANDVARLMVDVFVNGIDYQKDAEHKWEHFNQWRKTAAQVVQFSTITLDEVLAGHEPNHRIVEAMTWFQENLGNIFGNIADKRWEFQLALAMEFLRAGYREQLPTPKRVLGLVAGHDALRIVKNTLEEQYGTK